MTCGPPIPMLCLRVCRVRGVRVDSEPVPLPLSGLTIGSEGKTGDLHLDPAWYVAPTHAAIRLQHREWRVTPLSSKAVTTLNDRRLEAEETAPLTLGDRLEIGFVSLLVEQARVPDVALPDSLEALENDPLRALTNGEAPELETLLGLLPETCSASETERDSPPDFSENASKREPQDKTTGSNSQPCGLDDAQRLVKLLAEDVRREDVFLADSDPLVALLETVATPPGKETKRTEAGKDILERLAEESERALFSPEHGCAALPFLMDASPNETALWRAEETDPLAVLAPPDGASLSDVLEGSLSIDDVLERLGGGCAFPEEETVPDPLLLLARSKGEKPPQAVPALADILNRDHHRLSIETPYRQRGAVGPSSLFPDRNHSEETHGRTAQSKKPRQDDLGFPDWGTRSGRGVTER